MKDYRKTFLKKNEQKILVKEILREYGWIKGVRRRVIEKEVQSGKWDSHPLAVTIVLMDLGLEKIDFPYF